MPYHAAARSHHLSEHRVGPVRPFPGFDLPTSNTTYCPNQFFDVCLPHGSRGCVRLVSYLIRRTLGWSDAHGHPQEEQIAVSYGELVEKAHISRDMIRSAIDEAVNGHFIRCVRSGRAKGKGRGAETALYELAWDESGSREYVKNPKQFRGFFAGEGNRTYIPNQFFDRVIPNETLAMVKVVGSIIRFSIGFQTRYGFRRQQAAISYDDIQRYSKLRDRKTLAAAIKAALALHYVERVEEGTFDPNGGKESKAAQYALKWLNTAAPTVIGRKTLPAILGADDRSEYPTGIGPKTPPADRSENPTDIQITTLNNTSKQQASAPDAIISNEEGCRALRAAGFDTRTAIELAARFPIGRIARQIEWLPLRHRARNRLGMLRTAIEQDWSRPQAPSRTHEDAASADDDPANGDRRRVLAEQARALAHTLSVKRIAP